MSSKTYYLAAARLPDFIWNSSFPSCVTLAKLLNAFVLYFSHPYSTWHKVMACTWQDAVRI